MHLLDLASIAQFAAEEEKGRRAAHMALFPAGYCCKVRYVAHCLANIQLLCGSYKGAANLLSGGCELG